MRILSELGNAIGKGLLAGLTGTAAITISQMIEMRISRRKPSEAAIKVAGQITDVKPSTEESKQRYPRKYTGHMEHAGVWPVG